MHAKWSRPRVLVKLRGLVVNTIAWNRQQITEASTREVILGTDNGQLHEIAVDEKDKREKYVKFLFQLSELPQAFEGFLMEGGLTKSATMRQPAASIKANLIRFVTMEESFLLENRATLRAMAEIGGIIFYFYLCDRTHIIPESTKTIFASYVEHAVHFMELPGEIRNRQDMFLIYPSIL
ncbi:hypothetical protein L2E82_18875 [Cichorium intybus]|uniref:Uncharacterized protein n=1 Tax=Cichorium intybus TaxID=13427 RepID=A0ACB9FB73_CICIN|nr:hypothetical protein L2E82_18875 [Cichorium intybus]